MADIPERIDPTQAAKPLQPIQSDENQQELPQSFNEYMQKTPAAQAPETRGPSPFEVSQQQPISNAVPSMDSVQTQMNSTNNLLGDVQNQLNTKNLKLKQSQKYLLRNKLSEADAHIRTAASKTGVEVGPPPSMATRQNPIKRYLAYITDGQAQLAAAQSKIQELSASGSSLTPGQLLLIQVKLNKAQQAIEYSSVLLSKAIDDIKTLFNVQI